MLRPQWMLWLLNTTTAYCCYCNICCGFKSYLCVDTATAAAVLTVAVGNSFPVLLAVAPILLKQFLLFYFNCWRFYSCSCNEFSRCCRYRDSFHWIVSCCCSCLGLFFNCYGSCCCHDVILQCYPTVAQVVAECYHFGCCWQGILVTTVVAAFVAPFAIAAVALVTVAVADACHSKL